MPIEETRLTIDGADGAKISAYHWTSTPAPRAIMIVAHGMGEHAQRYKAGVAELIADGIDGYANDHRGHGRTASPDAFGDFGTAGFAGVVDDLAILTRTARARHPGLPVILLGHSMGSFAAQLFVLDHADLIDALALSGSAALDILAAAVSGGALGEINASFEPARTPFNWLSRDEAQVDTYIADPFCGFALTPESFGSLFSHAPRMADPKVLAGIPKTLPIYIFSGLSDPLAMLMHGLDPLIERYRQAGLSVTTDLYPEARHEILNETNRVEVVEKLAAWIDRVTGPA